MVYIFTALKSEAQAFVDKYKLKKIKIENYTLFTNSEMVVIITGVAIPNIIKSCEFIIKNYDVTQDDIFINVGICGAKYKIGTFLEIGRIDFNTQHFILNENIDETITCVDKEITDDNYMVVDMESYGFYKSLNSYKNIFIFKVVSDNFEPHTITKEKTKMLIFNNIDNILKKVNI